MSQEPSTTPSFSWLKSILENLKKPLPSDIRHIFHEDGGANPVTFYLVGRLDAYIGRSSENNAVISSTAVDLNVRPYSESNN